ncbi:MAG: 2-dehydropantoate 2-reductase [Lentisphaerae bacterium]|nr:2-dehydropantoate 2-reductase [Lentisphaerota bacterium]
MNIVVVGPGAMGCLFAALLKEAGHDVRLLDRDGARAREITERGLLVESDGATRTVPVRASADPAAIPPAPLAIIFVKAFDTAAAARAAAARLTENGTIVTLQNGLGNVEQIARCVPPDRIVCGSTAYGAETLGRGRVRLNGAGPTIVAPAVPAGAGRAAAVRELFAAAGIRAAARPDAASVLWSKLAINAGVNPVSAIFGVANGAVPRLPGARRLMHAAVWEAARTAAAHGIRLGYDDPIAEAELVCNLTAGNVSSMLQDVRRGRRTEIEQITGAVVKAAGNKNVAAPANGFLLRAVPRITRA